MTLDDTTRRTLINDDYTITASVKNKSKSKVTALRLNVTALDCPTQDARTTDCDIVGRSDGTFDADIPAGEVRQINGKITLREISLRGRPLAVDISNGVGEMVTLAMAGFRPQQGGYARSA
jgi:hypothetical protein